MKKIFSDKIGEILYEDKDVIHFPLGLYGFQNNKKYLLIKKNNQELFFYLQSIKDIGLTFILTNPKYFFSDYELKVEDEMINDLDLKQVIDFGIITIPHTEEKISINLMGPIIIDIGNQLGKQVISLKKDYKTKHYIEDQFGKVKKII